LRVSQTQRVAKRKQTAWGSLTIAKFDIQEETSLDVDRFEELHSILIRTSLVQVGKYPVRIILSTHVHLLMISSNKMRELVHFTNTIFLIQQSCNEELPSYCFPINDYFSDDLFSIAPLQLQTVVGLPGFL
jgi:hypothetical protein